MLPVEFTNQLERMVESKTDMRFGSEWMRLPDDRFVIRGLQGGNAFGPAVEITVRIVEAEQK